MAKEPEAQQTPEQMRSSDAGAVNQDLKPVEIDVGGRKLQFMPKNEEEAAAMEELRKGYLRQSDYTRKRQANEAEIARLKEEIERERAALRQRQVPGPAGGPDSPWYAGAGGSWPPVSRGGLQDADTYQMSGYPQTRTPASTGEQFAPDIDDDDVITGADMKKLLNQIAAQVDSRLQQAQKELQLREMQREADIEIERMEKDPTMPGFSRDAVEEVWWMLDESTRQRYQRIPHKADAYKMIWLEQILPAILQEQKAKTPEGGEAKSEPEQPPYAESTSSTNRETLEVAPDLSGPMTPDKITALGRYVRQKAQKRR